MEKYKILENGIYYAELDGTKGGYELGKQSGEIYANLIKENVNLIRGIYSDVFGKEKLNSTLYSIVNEAGYIEDLKKHMPALYDEMIGMADGSGIPFEDVVLLNYLEEVPLSLLGMVNTSFAEGVGKCTSVAIYNKDSNPNMSFQNMDYTEPYDGYQALYKIKYEEKEVLLYGFIGQFGGIGINSKGMSATVNVIDNGNGNTGCGLPSTAIIRRLLEIDSVDEGFEYLKMLPRSTSNSYVVADPVKVGCYEVSKSEVIFMEKNYNNYVVHTNHALEIDDVKSVEGQYNIKEILDDRKCCYSSARLKKANEILEKKSKAIQVDDAKEILSTEPILLDVESDGLRFYTIQSVINICDTGNPHIYVAKGEAKGRKYVKVGF